MIVFNSAHRLYLGPRGTLRTGESLPTSRRNGFRSDGVAATSSRRVSSNASDEGRGHDARARETLHHSYRPVLIVSPGNALRRPAAPASVTRVRITSRERRWVSPFR